MGEAQDDKLTFRPGDIVVREGEPGGDLLFLLEGSVEIFREKDGVTMPLSTMQKGEVLGLLTCLNDRPRMASAKALSTLVVKKVPHAQIMKSVKDLPQWLMIVLKEYQHRLDAMNTSFIDKSVLLKKASGESYNALIQARLFCSVVRALGKSLAVKIDGVDYILVDTLIEKMAEALDEEADRIKAIFTCLMHAGLISRTLEPDHKKEAVPLAIIEKLDDFIAFLKSLKLAKVRRMVHAGFSDKTFRFARSLLLYAKQSGLNVGSEICVTVGELGDKLEKVTGTAFEMQAVEILFDFKMAKFEKVPGANDEDQSKCKIKAVPSHLARTLSHISALKRLERLDGGCDLPPEQPEDDA